MASTAISVVTSLISGAVTGTHATTFSTAETITIYGPSEGDIDFSSLVIRVANSSAGTAIVASLTASDDFSDYTLGDYAFSVASGATAYIGGDSFDGSRFKHIATSGTVYSLITIGAATAGAKIEAVQAPYSHAG
jgi:hypothetical protein